MGLVWQVPIVGWLQIIVVIALSELWRYENVPWQERVEGHCRGVLFCSGHQQVLSGRPAR